MDHSKLKLKLETPEILALADDETRLVNLTANTVVEYIPISTNSIKTYLRMNGLWMPLKNSVADSAVTVFDALTDNDTVQFDMTDINVRGFVEIMLTTLINDVTEITVTHKDEVLDMGERLTSWATQNGYTPLRIGYFDKARAL